MNSFNPSFINAKWTILQQLEAIKKYLKDNESSIADIQSLRVEIENIKTQVTELYSEDVNLHELISQVETIAENALSLAQTNEQDIGTNDGEISNLNQQMARTLKLPLTAPSEDMIPVIKPNNSQDNIPLSSIGGGKVYQHKITLRDEQYVGVIFNVYSSKSTQFDMITAVNLSLEKIVSLEATTFRIGVVKSVIGIKIIILSPDSNELELDITNVQDNVQEV